MFRLCRLMLGLPLLLFITPALSDSLQGSNSRSVQNRSAVAVETSVAADAAAMNRKNAPSRRSGGRDRRSNVVSGASMLTQLAP